jgi:hypothetical protein
MARISRIKMEFPFPIRVIREIRGYFPCCGWGDGGGVRIRRRYSIRRKCRNYFTAEGTDNTDQK